jgi:hypothetical protein
MGILSNILAKLSEIHPLLGLAGIFACIFAPVVLLAVLTHRFVQGQKKSYEPEQRERGEILEDKPAQTQKEAIAPHKAATKAMPKVPALGVIVLTTLLGCVSVGLWVTIRENSYQKVFSPPKKAVEILGDTAKLYIRTEEGKAFFCGVYERTSPCVEIAPESVPKAKTLEPAQPRCSAQFSAPRAPSRVIAFYESCLQFIDGAEYARWIILDDGSVWVWRSGRGMFGSALNLLWVYLLLGAFLGNLAGVIIVLAIRISRWGKPQGRLAESKISDALLDKGETEKGVASVEK